MPHATRKKKKNGPFAVGVLITVLTFAVGYRLAGLKSETRPTPLPLASGAPINQPPPPAATSGQSEPGGGSKVGPAGAALRPTPAGLDPAQLAASVPAPPSRRGFLSLGFDQLSDYEYELNPDGTQGKLSDGTVSEIPPHIKKLDGKRVALSGFAIPLSYEDNKPTMFVLAKNQMLCCYGQAPKANEWAIITMKNPVEVALDKPIAISGTLHVGEMIEDGVVLCLYRLEGEEISSTER